MIFITGGAHQGKLDYAKKNYKLSDSDISDCADIVRAQIAGTNHRH